MQTLNETFRNAILTDASYVDGILPGITGSELADILTKRMTPEFANYIGQNFMVIDQASNFSSQKYLGSDSVPSPQIQTVGAIEQSIASAASICRRESRMPWLFAIHRASEMAERAFAASFRLPDSMR